MSRRLIATTGHEVLLRPGESCVGTDPAAEIPVLPATGMTPRHFVIHATSNSCFLRVCPSCEVRLNSRLVETAQLRDGDLIEAGNLELRFIDGDRPPVADVAAMRPPAAVVMRKPAVEALPLMLASLLFLAAAGWAAWVGFIQPQESLNDRDVIVRKGRLFSLQPHRNWLQAHTDLGLDRPVEVSRRVCESLFGQSWLCREELCGKDGLPVEIGFERKEFETGTATSFLGGPSRLHVATLQIQGVARRTLAQHNASLRDRRGTQQLLVLPLFAIGGLAGFVGMEKWRTSRGVRAYGAMIS